MDTFYATLSTFCFALVGLWWAVVQVRFEAWMPNPGYRRLAHSIHYTFLVPGGMSLGALLSGDQRLVWQGVFAVASVCGIAMAAGAITILPGRGWRIGQIVTLICYALILVVSLTPALVTGSGLGLAPLQVTGLLVTAIVVLGANFAWTVLTSAL